MDPEIKPEGIAHEGEACSEVDITLIVPVETADAPIEDVVIALGSEFDRLGRSWECLAIFDGSRGPAWDDAARLAKERPGQFLVIAFQQHFGESACLATGLEQARGKVIVTSPQYVQVDPREIESLLAELDQGADFAVPWRTSRVDPLLNRLQSAAFNLLIRRIIKVPFHDLNCYLRAIKRDVLSEMAIYGDMYRFLPVIALRRGFRVEEVKVRHLQEWGGSGFFGFGVYVRRFLDVLGVVFLTRFTLKPLRFFGTLGALFATIGVFLSTAVFFQWALLENVPLYSRPLFLVGVLLFVLGVQVIGFGLVGEIIIYTQAKNLKEYRIERVYEK
jgi:glycosyltransferase involved in cell wall biosynthesis